VNQMNEKFDEDILGKHVVAKKNFRVDWYFGRANPIAYSDVKFGHHGTVKGFYFGNPVVYIDELRVETTIGPFEDYWEFTDEIK
jgi:hypothetical protein